MLGSGVQMAANPPVPGERPGEAERQRRDAGGLGETDRRKTVVVVARDPVQILRPGVDGAR